MEDNTTSNDAEIEKNEIRLMSMSCMIRTQPIV